MARKSYYAVQNGRSNGVFTNWGDCKDQVNGYPGAVYKKFDTMEQARAYSSGGQSNSGYGSRNTDYGERFRSSQSGSRGDRNYEHHVHKISTPSARNQLGTDSSYGHHKSYKSSRKSSSGYPNYSRTFKAKPVQDKLPPEKYYAVRSSNADIENKIFDNWADCQRYVSGKGGLSFKKLSSESDAVDFINGSSFRDYEHIDIPRAEFNSRYKKTSTSKSSPKKCNVYCDGSALSNGQNNSRAGYGVYFEDQSEDSISEPLKNGASTNNRAEIQAVSSALDKIWTNLADENKNVRYQIKTDSEYVSKLLNDRYMGYDDEKLKSMPNGDLIRPLINKFAKVKQYYAINDSTFGESPFKIDWVKGHSGEPGNEIADQLARDGAAKR
ncbi:LADA_0H08416g1_1 [Lachancea dasiensis]|uniref:Ribonuclease H n=1 Tax=Lachancea dasiensis TaxID=1072105 RepID=A0A1G4K2J1_9SACH|nr:LADA_0H08416g1_1 [Lachancea dasiensis]